MTLDTLYKSLFYKVNGKYLAVFRILMGIVILKESYRIYHNIFSFYLEPDFLIKWPFIEWLPLFTENWLYLSIYILAVLGCFILVGFYSKISSAISLLIYGYFLFLDCSYYNNHYYMIFLILIIFTLVDADNQLSLKRYFFNTDNKVPAWNIGLLRFQIALVYFAGGLSKLNTDWLSGNTMRASIEGGAYSSFVNFFDGNIDIVVLILTHGGWVFDLLVPILLLIKKTRYWVIPIIILFHLSNIFNLNIGVFPYMMLGSTILFFGEGIKDGFKIFSNHSKPIEKQKAIYFVMLYVAFQILFPMRHFLFDGNYNITGEGYNFSWKMKGNAVELKQYDFYIIDINKSDTLDLSIDLHQKQYNRLYLSPSSNIYLAHYLVKNLYAQPEYQDSKFIVHAYVKVSLNGGPVKYLIDPELDLLAYSYSSFNQLSKIIIY